MLKKLCALALALFFVAGCATNYQGPGPNFSLKGTAAREEVERFTMDTSYFYHSPHTYQMGPEGSPYWASSLDPMIRDVSPEAARTLQHAKYWDYADFAFLFAALGVAIAHGNSPSGEGAYWALFGAAIGSGIVSNITVSNGLSEYNRDLRARFAPQLNVGISY